MMGRYQKQSFRPPAEGEVLLFCLSKREVPKRKRHPRFRALRASLLARFACGLRGLSTGLPALTPNWLASMQATLRADPPPTRRCRGDPGKAARILRALFRTNQATATENTDMHEAAELRRLGRAKRCPTSGCEQRWVSPAQPNLRAACASALSSFCIECGSGWPAALPGAPVRR
jgi:hypothetical protein